MRGDGSTIRIDPASVVVAFDERAGRPGPKPMRVDSTLSWEELVEILVRVEVPPGPDAEE